MKCSAWGLLQQSFQKLVQTSHWQKRVCTEREAWDAFRNKPPNIPTLKRTSGQQLNSWVRAWLLSLTPCLWLRTRKLELLMDEVPKMTILSVEVGLSQCERLSAQRRAHRRARAAEGRAAAAAASHQERSGTCDSIITAGQILPPWYWKQGRQGSAEGQHSIMILSGKSPCLFVLKRVLRASPALPGEGDFCRPEAASLAKRETPGLPSADTRRCQSGTKTPKPKIHFSFLILFVHVCNWL